jgi:hypothetical protein
MRLPTRHGRRGNIHAPLQARLMELNWYVAIEKLPAR